MMSAAGFLAGALAELNYRRIPVARAADPIDAGTVSIIVPARNEARRLPALLHSLDRLEYPQLEVLVVDDDSADDTASVAVAMGAHVISLDSLPDGWTGKAHACWRGARHASGDWLLFTDADTMHTPGSLSAALAAAGRWNVEFISLLCGQDCRTFWERLLLPYAYALYFAGRVRVNSSQRTAMANGQYILIRRHAYERIGGHAAIRDSIIDDVALAQRALRLGVPVRLLRGEELVRVRMYEDLPALWEGFSKNAVSFLAVSPALGALTALASLAFGSALPAAFVASSRTRRLAVAAAPALGLVPWMRRFGVSPSGALLYPLAASVFQLIAFDSIRRTVRRGGVRWKGRRY